MRALARHTSRFSRDRLAFLPFVGLRDATERLDAASNVILDGTSGALVINPSPAQLATLSGASSARSGGK